MQLALWGAQAAKSDNELNATSEFSVWSSVYVAPQSVLFFCEISIIYERAKALFEVAKLIEELYIHIHFYISHSNIVNNIFDATDVNGKPIMWAQKSVYMCKESFKSGLTTKNIHIPKNLKKKKKITSRESTGEKA